MRKKDPWTDPDPQPGDFDADIALMGPDDIQYVPAGSGAKVVEIGTDDVDGWLRRRRAERERAAKESGSGARR